MWIQIALFVASLVISYALQPKPTRPKPAAFEDFDFPTAEDGTPHIVVFGDTWLTDWTVIGTGNYRNEAIVAKQKGLFGTKKTETGFRYSMGIHFGLCNSLDDVIEIKVADKSIWSGSFPSQNILYLDQPDAFGGDKGEGGIQGHLCLMRGASNQPVLPQLSEMLGPDIPAYRGVATAFFDGLICSNSPYPKPWSLRVRRTQAGWDGEIWYPEKVTIWLNDNSIKAMNAAHIIYEAQTNRIWGRGFHASQLDLQSFKSVADQLYEEKFGICLAWRRQDSLKEFIQQVVNQIGAAFFVDRTTGLWKLILIRDNYQIGNLTTYDYSNGLLRIEEDDNPANDAVSNQVIVSYRDPVSNEDRSIYAENLAAIQQHGIIQEHKTYAGIATADIAGRIAARDLKIVHSALKRFKLVLNRKAYNVQPASVFILSLPERGIDSIIVRAVRIEHDVMTNGEITVTVVQDVFGLPKAYYAQQQPSLYQPAVFDPLPVSKFKIFELPYVYLLNQYSAEQLRSEYASKSIIAVAAQKPNAMHLDFEILSHTKQLVQTITPADFVFHTTILNSIEQTSAHTTLLLSILPTQRFLEVGSCVFIENEIVRIEKIVGLEVVVSRGCLDTVPKAYTENTDIWFFDHTAIVIEELYSEYSTIFLQFITRTSQARLSEHLAPIESFKTTKPRHFKPYPPANIKINDVAYLKTVTTLDKISWDHRDRISQMNEIVDQLQTGYPLETDTTYTLRVYKKMFIEDDYFLASELTDLTSTMAFADTNKGVTPGINDFFKKQMNKGVLTAVNNEKATKTTQRLCLARPQVGQFYGLLLDPNMEGSSGFESKFVEEEFLESDSSLSFLNRLKTKIDCNLKTFEKTAIKFGLFHSLTHGWRCEGASGRVLEISHSDPGQAIGNVIHIVLYAANGEVLFHHRLNNAYRHSSLKFDSVTERCWFTMSYDGDINLNAYVQSKNIDFYSFNFDDIAELGIYFLKTPQAVQKFNVGYSFDYKDGLLWVSSSVSNGMAPIDLIRLNPITLEVISQVSYRNPEVDRTQVPSLEISDHGNIVLTDTALYFTEDRYYDADYPLAIKWRPVTIAKFDRSSGQLQTVKPLNSESADILAYSARVNGRKYGKYLTTYGSAETFIYQWLWEPTDQEKMYSVLYHYDTGTDFTKLEIPFKNRQFSKVNPISATTGIYQFYTAGTQQTGVFGEIRTYFTSMIYDTRTWSEVKFADCILVKSTTVSTAPLDDVVGFPTAAYLDIEFDVPGKFFFEPTSNATGGTGPNGAALFADLGDAVAAKIEVWSVRANLESLQKQVLEVFIHKN